MAQATFIFEDDHELEHLRRLTGRERQGDVIKDALKVYQYLVDRVREGRKVYTEGDDFRQEIEFPWIR